MAIPSPTSQEGPACPATGPRPVVRFSTRASKLSEQRSQQAKNVHVATRAKTTRPHTNNTVVQGLTCDQLVDALVRLSNTAQPTFAPVLEQSQPSLALAPVNQQVRLKPAEIDELVAAYESGVNVAGLATSFKIHRTTVMARLRRRGVRTRRNVRKLNDEQVDQAAGLYVSGMPLAAVGTELGVNAEVIRRELIRTGIARRASGRRPQEHHRGIENTDEY